VSKSRNLGRAESSLSHAKFWTLHRSGPRGTSLRFDDPALYLPIQPWGEEVSRRGRPTGIWESIQLYLSPLVNA
jgi:hypothetical protein